MITVHNSLVNLKLQNDIQTHTTSFTKSLERMISGFRINRAADDPAGQYISSRFITQVRGLETANKNIQAGIDILDIADTSIEEMNTIMSQIREVISESCNEYLTPEQRQANQTKINELFKQAQNIKNDAEYNGQSIFTDVTILDKNSTYKNGVVTTAAGQALTQISEEASTTSTETSAASYTTTPDEGVSTASTLSLDGEDYYSSTMVNTDDTTSADDAGIMLLSAEEDLDSGIMTVGLDDELDAGIMVASDSDAAVAASIVETGTIELAAGEEKIYTIGEKTYTITSDDYEKSGTYSITDNGEIIFSISSVSITAAEGQVDNIILTGGDITLNTGDMDDIVTDNGVSERTTQYANSIYMGEGNDTIAGTALSGRYFDVENGFATDGNWGKEGQVIIEANSTVNATINGKNYTITNNDSNYGHSLTYSTTNDGEIVFDTNQMTITAADGQEDNIIVSGIENTVNTGDLNDKVTIAEYSYGTTVNTGDGNDIIINNSDSNYQFIDGGSGTNYLAGSASSENVTQVDEVWGDSGSVSLNENEEKTVLIDNKVYRIISSYGTATVDYSVNNGIITIDTDNCHILAATGQEDNLVIIGDNNYVDANDMNDNIVITGNENTAYGGSGDDNIKITGDENSANDYTGNDTIAVYGSNNNAIGNEGDDKITVSGDSNTVYGGDGSDTLNAYGDCNTIYGSSSGITTDSGNEIRIIGDNNTAYGAEGDDKVVISGDNNTAYGGASGYDTISEIGQDNVYSQMDEAQGGTGEFRLHISENFNTEYDYNLTIKSPLSDLTLDVSTYDSAVASLQALDDAVLTLTSARVDIGFQGSMLEELMEKNLAKITNLNNSLSTVRDADTAAEYSNLLAKAAMVETTQMLQTQIAQNQANILSQLIWNL